MQTILSEPVLSKQGPVEDDAAAEDTDDEDDELLELTDDASEEADEEDMLLSANASGMKAATMLVAVNRERDFFIRKNGERTHAA